MKCRPGFDGGLDQSFLLEVEEVPFYLFVPFYLVVPFYEDDDNDHDLNDHDLDNHDHDQRWKVAQSWPMCHQRDLSSRSPVSTLGWSLGC